MQSLYKYSNALLRKLLLQLKGVLYARDDESFQFEARGVFERWWLGSWFVVSVGWWRG